MEIKVLQIKREERKYNILSDGLEYARRKKYNGVNVTVGKKRDKSYVRNHKI